MEDHTPEQHIAYMLKFHEIDSEIADTIASRIIEDFQLRGWLTRP